MCESCDNLRAHKYITSLCDVCQDFYITLWHILIMSTAKRIGQNLKDARKFKNLTQREVAEKLHMTQQQYSRFENGVFELNYDQIIILCELLEKSPTDLFNNK